MLNKVKTYWTTFNRNVIEKYNDILKKVHEAIMRVGKLRQPSILAFFGKVDNAQPVAQPAVK